MGLTVVPLHLLRRKSSVAETVHTSVCYVEFAHLLMCPCADMAISPILVATPVVMLKQLTIFFAHVPILLISVPFSSTLSDSQLRMPTLHNGDGSAISARNLKIGATGFCFDFELSSHTQLRRSFVTLAVAVYLYHFKRSVIFVRSIRASCYGLYDICIRRSLIFCCEYWRGFSNVIYSVYCSFLVLC